MQGDGSAGRFRDALRSRDLRLLCGVLVVDGLGSWASSTVLVVYIFERTGSTTWIALLAAARWLPGLLLASYGGVLADRYERRRVIVVTDLLSFGIMLAMAGVVAVDGPLWLLLVITAVSAAVLAPNRPATGALTPEVVPERDLTAANGLFSTLESLVVVIGPGIGGVLAALGRPVLAVGLNAVSFLVAALIAMALRVRSQGDATEVGESAFKAFTDGLGALRSNSVATALVLFCALDSGIFGASSVLFVHMSEQLGTGVDGYGYLLVGSALGGVVAAGIANRFASSHRLAPVIIGGIAVQALPFAAMIWVQRPSIGFLMMLISGTGMIVVDVLAITALQRDMPRGVLGRVLSLLDVAVLISILFCSFAFAYVYEAADLHLSLLIVGVGFPLIALLGIRPMLRADRANVALLREIEPRIAVLHELDLFGAATRPMLEGLARAVEVVEVPAGTRIIQQGDPADALWIVVEGEVVVGVDGRSVRTLGPGTYVGEIGLLHGIPRIASVRTRGDARLWRLSGEAFLEATRTAIPSPSLLGISYDRLSRSQPQLAAALPGAAPAEPR